jgi:hypothetical protein
MPKIHRVPQGSAEWYQLRVGKPTASQFHKILTPGGKPSAQARAYMYRLIAERLLRESMDDAYSHVEWVERGKVEEPNAAAQFSYTQNVELEEVGFITSDDGQIGCSPDRLVKDKAEAVEIKCPAAFTQIGYLLDGPGDQYRAQVQGHLLVGQFDKLHFYGWHPRMPACHIITVRDEPYLKLLATALRDFCDMLNDETHRARKFGSYVIAPKVELPVDKDVPAKEPFVYNVPGMFPEGGQYDD